MSTPISQVGIYLYAKAMWELGITQFHTKATPFFSRPILVTVAIFILLSVDDLRSNSLSSRADVPL